jgi:FAD/FMN-containing dehydrogenase
MNVHTRWEDKNLDDMCVEWARKFSDETGKFATGGVYVNFISEGENRVNSAFGSNYDKLAKLKKKYDPDNFFKTNQNIKPS